MLSLYNSNRNLFTYHTVNYNNSRIVMYYNNFLNIEDDVILEKTEKDGVRGFTTNIIGTIIKKNFRNYCDILFTNPYDYTIYVSIYMTVTYDDITNYGNPFYTICINRKSFSINNFKNNDVYSCNLVLKPHECIYFNKKVYNYGHNFNTTTILKYTTRDYKDNILKDIYPII